MKDQYLDVLIQTAIDGGKISLTMMENSKPTLKPDHSVLTQADIAVSKLVRKNLAQFLKSPDHLLIDEEDKESHRYFNQDVLAKIPYVWVADPIDGTRNFANRMPMYGVSLGLLKDCKPWLGVIYFPVLDELFYCDGQTSFFVKYATSQKPFKTIIKAIDQPISHQSVFYASDKFFKSFDWNFDVCQIMLPSCAVLDLCWPTIGRGVGAFFNAHIWDYAGAWPIVRSAGLDLRHLTSGQVMEQLDISLFQGKGDKMWRLRDFYILSSARNFPIIRDAMTSR